MNPNQHGYKLEMLFTNKLIIVEVLLLWSVTVLFLMLLVLNLLSWGNGILLDVISLV